MTRSGAGPSPLPLQPAHDLVELIEAAISHVHDPRLATMIDRDFEPECISDSPLERHRVGVLATTAQLPGRGRRRLAVLLAGPAPLLDLAHTEPHLDDLLRELLGVGAADQHAGMAGTDLA